MRPTILLVDDHSIFRQGLRALTEQNETAVVAGEARDGAEAVQMAGELLPDLVIMDLTMPVMTGIDATREITHKFPTVKVLALSMESNRFFVVEAIKAGASGYLLKDTAFAELAEAIEIVASGEIYLPRQITTLLVREFLQCIPAESSIVYDTSILLSRGCSVDRDKGKRP